MPFTEKRLCDMAEVFSGFAFRSDDFEDTGIPVIRIANIQGKRVLPECKVHFPKRLYTDKLQRFVLRPDDFLIAMTGAGSVGKVGKMIGMRATYLVNQRVAIIRANRSICCPDYIFYAMSQDRYEELLYGIGLGAGQPNISPANIGSVPIPFPPLAVQQKIVAILSAYDDLIENNERRIRILEEMAQNLYREWFVKFRFPGHKKVKMVESPLGKIPEGWEVRELNEFVDFERGVEPGSKNYASQLAENYVPFLRVGDLGKRTSDLFIEKSFAKGRMLTPDDIAITMDGTVGLVSMGLTGAYSSGIRRVVPKSNCTIGNAFVFLLLQSEHIQAIIESHAKGTTIKHASSSIGHMMFVLPDKAVADAFEEYARPLNSLALSLGSRNAVLRRTRDLLLPRMISGELDVSELEIELSAMG